MSEQAGRYTRSAAGLVGAMVVLVVVVLAFVLVRDLLRDELQARTPTVDYRQVASAAQEQAEFDLLVPRRLPEGWQATSARYTPASSGAWHLGLLTDEEEYVGLEQATESTRELVSTYVDRDAVRGEDVTVGGLTWTTWTDEGGDLALVRSDGEVATLVVGSGDRRDVEILVETLVGTQG